MKDQILKIAKVKNEAEFYRKYPTEEAFMAKHGKAFKKAAMGTKMVQTQLEQLTDFGNPPIAQNGFAFGDAITNVNAMNAGITKEEQMKRDAMAQLQAKDNPPVNKYSGIMDSISGIGRQVMDKQAMSKKAIGGGEGVDGGLAMRKGGKLKKAFDGLDFSGLGKAVGTATQSKGGLGSSLLDMFGGDSKKIMNVGAKGALGAGGAGFGAGAKAAGLGIVNAAPDILNGISQINEQKANIKKADQTAQISGVTAQAAESQDISMSNRKYVRPEDALVQPGQLGSPQGTGTNYLAQYGAHVGGNPTEIQNMYNPGNLYNDLGFTPLNDDNVKQFQKGGKLISRDKIDIDSYGNQGTAFRDIYQNPNMTQDTTYAYDSPSAMLRFNTNGGNPNAYVGGRGGFTSSQPDSLAKYKQLLSSPFNSNEPSGIKRLASGNYQDGGDLPTAEFGDYFQNSGQASIGKGVGSAVGTAFFGPLGGAVGGALGSVVGNVFGGADDANKLANLQTQNKENIERSAWAAGAKSLHGANSSFMEDGGWMNPEYNPQVIAKFGDLTAQDFYNASKEMRSGGHLAQVDYTPPSARALQTYEYGGQMAMGGDLQVARGKAEPMSYNPYLPEGGETVMFKGPSHDDGGMDIQYGQNGVEVEGGEPAVKLADGGSPDGNLVVFGNMKIDDMAANHIGVEASKGKKYKSFIKDLSKFESRQNKVVEKGTELVDASDTNDPFDQLAMNSGKAMMMGGNAKLLNAAIIKERAAGVQNAILDTAKEYGVKSDELSQGKFVIDKDSDMAKFGAELKKAQDGSIVDYLKGIGKKSDFASRKVLAKDMGIKNYKGTAKQNIEMLERLNTKTNNSPVPARMSNYNNALSIGENIVANALGSNYNPYATTVPYQQGYNNLPEVTVTGNRQLIGGPSVPEFVNLTDKRGPNYAFATTPEEMAAEAAKGKGETKKNSKFGDAALMLSSGLADYFRPIRQFPLDPSETMAEQYALGNNQVDPVYAQTYQPMLDQPYDISLQDQINMIDAQTNAAIRASGINPAAQAQIMAQALQAKQQVYGNQFRANQENKNRVYQGNRAAINDSAFKNMGILDNQQVRQSQAKSATKAQTIAALSSISDKVTRNKQENLIAAIDQNRNNFRIDSQGRAINFNSPAQFNMSGSPFSQSIQQGSNTIDIGGKKYRPIDYDNKTGQPTKFELVGKNGANVKARNGSIVKALKSL